MMENSIKVVNAEIDRVFKQYEQIAAEEELSPVAVDGRDHFGGIRTAYANPAVIAKIFLAWDYPVYKVLSLDAPQGMWSEIARVVGLADVFGVDM